jgi:uncharacterized iron-regulated protein
VTVRAGAALAVALITVALGFLALVARADPPPAPPWESALGREHPLTGRIWEPASGRFVTAAALATRLAAARFVLLGEKHDNADHHRLQAWLLRELLSAGRRPAVAFEMFSVDDDATIARQRASTPLDAAALARAVDWSRSGWPDFRLYEPIVRAALEAGVPVVGANLSRAVTQTVRRGGIGALDSSVRARLGLERVLPLEASIALFAEIRRSHCDAIPDESIERMADVQRARDAQMAEALVRAATRDGAVLIAGAGHTRADRGVPWALARQAPGAPVVALALVEVRKDLLDPAGYGPEGTAYDAVWFTPRVDDRDPCESFPTPGRPRAP